MKKKQTQIPSNRFELITLFRFLQFSSEEEYLEYKKEPLWRKILGQTKFERHLKNERTDI